MITFNLYFRWHSHCDEETQFVAGVWLRLRCTELSMELIKCKWQTKQNSTRQNENGWHQNSSVDRCHTADQGIQTICDDIETSTALMFPIAHSPTLHSLRCIFLMLSSSGCFFQFYDHYQDQAYHLDLITWIHFII